MTTTPGSILPTVKVGLRDRWKSSLELGGVSVTLAHPGKRSEATGETGRRELVYFDDEATSSGTITALGVPVLVDETLSLTVHVQVYGLDTDTDQHAAEVRAAELLGVLVDDIGANPGEVTLDGWEDITVTVDAWSWQSGPLENATNLRGAHVVLTLNAEGRRC